MRRAIGIAAAIGAVLSGAQAVSVFFTFTPSVSPDVAAHECRAFERHMEPCECPEGMPPPCYCISAPQPIACPIEEGALPPGPHSSTAAVPAVGQVIYGCIRAVDAAGNASDCVTQESWP